MTNRSKSTGKSPIGCVSTVKTATDSGLLDEREWVYFKLYRDPSAQADWKSKLDWYHQALLTVVRPIVENTPDIRMVFFGLYGPARYEPENEDYDKRITPPSTNVIYIRLRLSVPASRKEAVAEKFLRALNANRNLIWEHEKMTTYHIREDLGRRYGSNNDEQTVRFARYWDAACRYILSILTMPGNWLQDVDVWGIPHLVNNSLGVYLRVSGLPSPCGHQVGYLEIDSCQLSAPAAFQEVPVFRFRCPICNRAWLASINI